MCVCVCFKRSCVPVAVALLVSLANASAVTFVHAMLFSVSRIANCSPSERASRWTFLKGLLHTWTHMATSDPTFLVEVSPREAFRNAAERHHLSCVL